MLKIKKKLASALKVFLWTTVEKSLWGTVELEQLCPQNLVIAIIICYILFMGSYGTSKRIPLDHYIMGGSWGTYKSIYLDHYGGLRIILANSWGNLNQHLQNYCQVHFF